jgi:hypothetical protein
MLQIKILSNYVVNAQSIEFHVITKGTFLFFPQLCLFMFLQHEACVRGMFNDGK